MKILLQGPTARRDDSPVSREIGKMIIECASRSKRPETELFFRPSTGLSEIHEIGNLGSRFRNDRVILDNALANSQSMDGAVIYCYFDAATWPARQMLDIPVAGLAESAMMLAPLVGRRFAVLSSEQLMNSRGSNAADNI